MQTNLKIKIMKIKKNKSANSFNMKLACRLAIAFSVIVFMTNCSQINK